MNNNKTSLDRIKIIQQSLSDLSNSLVDTYCKMRKECIDEIVGQMKNLAVQKNEMYKFYEQLSMSEQRRINYIKEKLPWYMTLFRKIHSYEISLQDTYIFIGVRFGNDTESKCYIKLTPKDIGWQKDKILTDET